jgi:hypothetical protein
MVIIGATIVAAEAPDTKSTPNLYPKFLVFHAFESFMGSFNSGFRVTVCGLSIFIADLGVGGSMLNGVSSFMSKQCNVGPLTVKG